MKKIYLKKMFPEGTKKKNSQKPIDEYFIFMEKI